ncbi:MAG: carboxymuconolactone decarboxylase family protein [Microthrixaceae bacterium]
MEQVEDVAPLLSAPEDHPQEQAAEHDGCRVMLMDSARYCDERNTGDVVIAASYCGVLPVRLVAPHRPRGVIAHDVGIAADGSGIAGLWYLEALGIPAASVAAESAELGQGRDMYDAGVISRVNILAERCGVELGMPVARAAELLGTRDPGNREATTKVRRETKESDGQGHSIVVTDSIVFALPEDTSNVLVTAGHTGKTGAVFIEAVSPRGFICADGGPAKNGSGTSGLAALDESGLPGACYDVSTAAMGDAFDAWERGTVSAANELARARGVRPGQTVRVAAALLLATDTGLGDQIPADGTADPTAGTPTGTPTDPPADPTSWPAGSPILRSGELAGVSAKFAEGLARVRDVTDVDGALSAPVKALFMACAAAVKGHESMLRRELRRAVDGGITLDQVRGAAVSVLISRGEGVYERFRDAAAECFDAAELVAGAPTRGGPGGGQDLTTEDAFSYFTDYFGFVPDYIELMATHAARALEGYVLMRQFALAENLLEPKLVELLLCTVNAAEFSARFVDVHAGGARRAGATEAEVVESVVCAIPVAGVASWLPGSDGIALGQQ